MKWGWSERGRHSQDLVVAQSLSGRTAVPAAVWDVPVGRDDVERVVDEVVLEDAVVGRAGGQRGGGVDLTGTRTKGRSQMNKYSFSDRLCPPINVPSSENRRDWFLLATDI